MKLPKSLNDISVEKYQELHPYLFKDDLDSKIKVLSLVSGLSIKHLTEVVDSETLKKCFHKIRFLRNENYPILYKYIWIKGSLYKRVENERKLTTGQYVGIKSFLTKGSYIEMLPDLAPCCYRKFRLRYQYKVGDKTLTKWFGFFYDSDNHEELREAFKKKSAHKVLPVVFFCSKVLLVLIKDTEDYTNSLKIIKERMQELQEMISEEASMIIGDGKQR
jgi:hypothetical protein